MVQGRLLVFLVLVLALTGCEETATPPDKPNVLVPLADQYQSEGSCRLRGSVRLAGTPPVVAHFRSIDQPLTDQPPPPARDWPNPNACRLTDQGRLQDALVFLSGIKPQASRPWFHEPVTVELVSQQFVVRQGSAAKRLGIVQQGRAVRMVSRDDLYHAVQGRGAAFFGLSLPAPQQVREQRLDHPGLVELRSGAGYYWMRAFLLVSPHPYVTTTDARGEFSLDGIPPGDYEVVAWHPSWVVQQEERNQDNSRIQQVRFRTGLETSARVSLGEGAASAVDLTLTVRK
ncbi:MAG: carboxypeptidase-like regulatory domain-containing protein [Gemmataceae bacterium]